MKVRIFFLILAFSFAFPMTSFSWGKKEYSTYSSGGLGAYVGASVGFSLSPDFCDNNDNDSSARNNLECSNGVMGFKLDAGYTFYKELEVHIGGELAFVGSGEFSWEETNNNFFKQSSRGFGGFAVGTYPLSETISLQGKLGAFFFSTTLKQERGSGSRDEEDETFSALGVAFGAAAQLLVLENIGIRAEWNYFTVGNRDINDNGSRNIIDEDLKPKAFHLLSLGILYHF